MGIVAEYNPELALRAYAAYNVGTHTKEECIPETLIVGETYAFKKNGQRVYYLEGEIPLITTDGTQLSLPLASVTIRTVQHSVIEGKICTTGTYTIQEVFTDAHPHFNGFAKIEV